MRANFGRFSVQSVYQKFEREKKKIINRMKKNEESSESEQEK